MPENSNKKFTHLHVHSHYSLLDGLAKIDELLDRAKEMGMDSLALTDHGVMYGAVEFSIKAKERGIKPIIGCEMYVSHDLTSKNNTALDRKMHHLTLLVKDEDGYKNLMHLVSIAHLEGFYYKPRIDKKTLRKYSTGLIAMSGCLAGEIPNEINNANMNKFLAKEIFSWNFNIIPTTMNRKMPIRECWKFPKKPEFLLLPPEIFIMSTKKMLRYKTFFSVSKPTVKSKKKTA